MAKIGRLAPLVDRSSDPGARSRGGRSPVTARQYDAALCDEESAERGPTLYQLVTHGQYKLTI
jgi:hypothetical protein